MTIAKVHCTAGLLLHQGKRVYVAIPASCGALPLDEGKVQDGCVAASAPIGTPARVEGASKKPILVYDSFTWMESRGVRKPHQCYYNDLALLKLSRADAKTARGAIPGVSAPKTVSSRGPAVGSHLSFGSGSATAGATTKNGWVFQLATTPPVTVADVGTPVTRGGKIFGMLIVLPAGMVQKTPAAAYNLHRAIRLCRKAKGFHHVALLRAGQHL